MNVELIKSWVLKLLPVVTGYLVGKGLISQSVADQIGPVVDWLIVGLVLIPTLWRSWRKYKVVKLEPAP